MGRGPLDQDLARSTLSTARGRTGGRRCRTPVRRRDPQGHRAVERHLSAVLAEGGPIPCGVVGAAGDPEGEAARDRDVVVSVAGADDLAGMFPQVVQDAYVFVVECDE